MSAPTDALADGIRLFNEEYFFEAHEHLEGLWREERGPSRAFLQGLIQICAGFHHFQNGNLTGAVALLRRGADKVRGYPSPHLGIDTASLLARVDALRTEFEGMRTAGADRTGIAFPKIDLPRA